MEHLTRYDHLAYDSLPELQDAATELSAKNGNDIIKGPLRDIFMKHKVHLDFSTQLLHRHFPMDPHEKLVEYGPTQSPWPAATVARVVGGHIIPKSWRIWGDDLHPYEFRFVSLLEDPCPGPTNFSDQFVQDLKHLLTHEGLLSLLGVTSINHDQPGTDTELMEVTYGRNSIMIPVISGEVPEESYNAGWGFVDFETQEDTNAPKFEIGASAVEGVNTAHALCAAVDGVKTRHGACLAVDGVKTRHGACLAADGVNTAHALCAAVDGVKTRHGACLAADGVKTRHGACLAVDGVKTRHGACLAVDGPRSHHDTYNRHSTLLHSNNSLTGYMAFPIDQIHPFCGHQPIACA